MNIFQVSYKNLFRRKMRTTFTVFGIMLSIWVLVTLLGFNRGYENSLNNNIEGMGFQLVLTAKGCLPIRGGDTDASGRCRYALYVSRDGTECRVHAGGRSGDTNADARRVRS